VLAADTSSEPRRPCRRTTPSSLLCGKWGHPYHQPAAAARVAPLRSGHSSAPPLTALCKSPHMLPRVPVSQRHSRASFRVLRYVRGTDCLGQEGAIKRSLTNTGDTHVPTDTVAHIRTEPYTRNTRRPLGGETVYLRVRVRARVLFSASFGADTISSSHRLAREDRR